MRILQVGKFYPPHRGGIETCLADLCAGLRAHHEVHAVVANDGHSTQREIIDGIAVTRLANLISISGAPVCPRMVREIRDARADLVHLHLPNPSAVLAYAASGVRAPTVVTWHSDIVRQRVLKRIYEPIERRVLDRCDAIVASSGAYARSSPTLSNFGDRIRVIPFGIALNRLIYRDASKIAALRARFGDRIVLTIGRLVYYKGFEHLIAAMADVRGHLVIVGVGPLRDSLAARARDIGVAERVTFVGEIEELSAYYHAADVFVLPSIARSEAFGIVQIEAMAAGTPVINTALDSGVPTVSLDGLTGFTVPPADPHALARAINLLLDNTELRARMGAAARKRAHSEFDLKTMTRRTLELYDDVVYASASRTRLSA